MLLTSPCLGEWFIVKNGAAWSRCPTLLRQNMLYPAGAGAQRRCRCRRTPVVTQNMANRQAGCCLLWLRRRCSVNSQVALSLFTNGATLLMKVVARWRHMCQWVLVVIVGYQQHTFHRRQVLWQAQRQTAGRRANQNRPRPRRTSVSRYSRAQCRPRPTTVGVHGMNASVQRPETNKASSSLLN